MNSTVVDDPVAEAISALAAAVCAVEHMPLTRRDAVGQSAAYAQVEELCRKLEFAQLRMVRALEVTGAPAAMGAPSMTALLRGLVRLSPAEASARVRAAHAMCDGFTLTGEVIPRALSAVADAAAAGILDRGHIRVIVSTMDHLPGDLDAEIRDSAERTMVEHAQTFDPQALGRIGRLLLHRIAPKDPDPEDVARRRGLSFSDDLPGMTAIRGTCSTETAAIIQSALDPLAKPHAEVDGIKDLRTRAQRLIDGLEELASRAMRRGDLPAQGGERPHVSLVVRPGTASAELPWVGPVPLENMHWMLCDSVVTPIEIDESGVPRRIGQPGRTVPPWLRRSVIARDRGCTFPGCDRPATWSDIHHVIEWDCRGIHQLENLVVLCGYHHKLIHQQRWEIRFLGRVPHYLPPRWIDADQRPQRNRLHHLQRSLPMRT